MLALFLTGKHHWTDTESIDRRISIVRIGKRWTGGETPTVSWELWGMVLKFLWNCVPKIDPGPHICGRVTLWRWRRCRFPPIFYQLWSHHSRLQISTTAAPRYRCNRTPVVSAAEFVYWPICGIDDYSGRLKWKLEIDNSLNTKSIVSSSTYYSTNLGSS